MLATLELYILSLLEKGTERTEAVSVITDNVRKCIISIGDIMPRFYFLRYPVIPANLEFYICLYKVMTANLAN